MKAIIKFFKNIEKKNQVYVLLTMYSFLNSLIYKRISISYILDPFLIIILSFLTIVLSSLISVEMDKKNHD